MKSKVSYRCPSPRAARYLDACAGDDPLVLANALVDRAVVLQDQGRVGESLALLARADVLLEGEGS